VVFLNTQNSYLGKTKILRIGMLEEGLNISRIRIKIFRWE
jgi:hypothetical protein